MDYVRGDGNYRIDSFADFSRSLELEIVTLQKSLKVCDGLRTRSIPVTREAFDALNAGLRLLRQNAESIRPEPKP